MSFLIFNAFVFAILGQRPINWESLNCPGSVADETCTYTNNYNNDLAISLFFQTESNDGSYFSCYDTSNDDIIIYAKEYYNSKISAGKCPNDYTYSTGNNGWEYCLLTGITFPNNVQEYCDYVTSGYEGYSWTTNDDPNYQCPSYMNEQHDNDGTSFCTEEISSSYVFPDGTTPYCGADAFNAGELGFRWGGQPTSAPTPAPTSNGTVYCERNWNTDQQGSAGDCYFLLKKGKSYKCEGKGDTNIIGAHGVQLNGTIFSDKSNAVSCPNNKEKSCQYTNENSNDEIVGFSFASTSDDMSYISCSYSTNNNAIINVCNFTSNAENGSGSSCYFIIPSGKTLQCNSDNISIKGGGIESSVLNDNYLGKSEPMNGMICPNKTYPNDTMCDCSFTNPYSDTDLLVIVDATNTDNQFASFHCGTWGVNICAFGVNNGNLQDSDSCWFILPAGAEYDCYMEWGSSAFTYSTMLPLSGTIYQEYNSNNDGLSKVNKPKGNKIRQTRSNDELRILFNKWKTFYNKEYSNIVHENYRFDNFKTFISLYDNNMNKIIGQPKISIDNIHKISSFADLTKDEFERYYQLKGFNLVNIEDRINEIYKLKALRDIKDIPSGFNWVDKGAITPVKDQGQCGSCWSFGTTGVLESHFFIAGNPLQSLSEQNLVSCDTECYACNGGWPYKAIEYVSKNGIDTEESYPYVSGNGNVPGCQATYHTKATITGHVVTYKYLEQNEDVMANYIANNGPIQVNVDAMTQLWWPYTGGIMTGCCNVDIDHSVMIVGYNQTSNGDRYWIVKNSWSNTWGESGYLWLQYGTDQCGIKTQAMIPVLD